MTGYMGKLLRVNLTAREIAEEPLNLDLAWDYLGGVGYATHIVYHEVSPAVDPLSPENKLVFMVGPLTGTPFPTSSRYIVATKSPLTGIWGDASSSGFWATELKRAGYDGIIIEGAAENPTYLLIHNHCAALKDATHLWGQDTMKVQGSIKRELEDRGVRVAAIGSAGEKQVLLASIINDDGRAAGRGGLGAVMGAKKLKAIAVRGTGRVGLAAPARFRERVREIEAGFTGPGLLTLSKWGTGANMEIGWVTGDVPVQNWRRGSWKEGCLRLSGRRFAETVLKHHGACRGCPIRCSRWVKIENGDRVLEGPGPEYQTLASFGPLCLNDDLETICKANDLCNRYGLDTVSTGAVIAFAMEAHERGILSKGDAQGLELSWGNGKTIIELIEQIGKREGLGELLGQGVRRASSRLGRGSEGFAVHVKGLEVPMHDPRAFFGLTANYATGTRGSCYVGVNLLEGERGDGQGQSGWRQLDRFSDEGKGLIAKRSQDRAAVINSLVICLFAAHGLTDERIAEVLNLATGLSFSADGLRRIGERIINLQRAFSLRCGLSGKEDRLPRRLLEATPDGAQAGRMPNIDKQRQEYYQARGWSKEGKPSRQKLEELGLGAVAGELGL